MKTRGMPVQYDLYGGKPCYHVELFEEELRMLECALDVFCNTKLYDAIRHEDWNEAEATRFDDAFYQLTFALTRIEEGNVVPTGVEVEC